VDTEPCEIAKMRIKVPLWLCPHLSPTVSCPRSEQKLICIKAQGTWTSYGVGVMSKSKVITLDVREDIRNGREPFSKIMRTVSSLKPNEDLRLLAPFEPAPLYAVLAQHGFSPEAKRLEAGDWEVLFTRDSQAAPKAATNRATKPNSAPKSADGGPQTAAPLYLEVDARGLEPPQPLVKILEAVAALPEGKGLRAHTDRRPMHLYDKLAERGFAGETSEQADGSFITEIRRKSS
jgi:uncharacterized protein (DUF2249 family)